MIKIKTKKGYKVCSYDKGIYYSSNGYIEFSNEPGEEDKIVGIDCNTITYEEGIWVFPKETYADIEHIEKELSVFKNLIDAQYYCYPSSDLVILECEYEPVSWWRFLQLYFGEYSGCPRGKRFAKRVKIGEIV